MSITSQAISAAHEIAVGEATRDFQPLASHLVERYYGTREHYISALEEQAASDLLEIESAPTDAPVHWLFGRACNAAICETNARLERGATRVAPAGETGRTATGTESARQMARTGSASTGSTRPVQESLL